MQAIAADLLAIAIFVLALQLAGREPASGRKAQFSLGQHLVDIVVVPGIQHSFATCFSSSSLVTIRPRYCPWQRRFQQAPVKKFRVRASRLLPT